MLNYPLGSCCPTCLAEWTDENEEEIKVTEQSGPVVFQCILDDQVLVSPDDVSHSYSYFIEKYAFPWNIKSIGVYLIEQRRILQL